MCNQPLLVIVMGVSGSGKTTLGKALAKCLNYHFLDADDFHSEKAKKQMAASLPLTDEQREPWITRIISSLSDYESEGKHIVLAYSGLKLKHRDRFRDTSFNVKFIWLQGEEYMLKERLSQRKGHFALANFLPSQLKDLEMPMDTEPDILAVTISLSPDEIKARSIEFILETNSACEPGAFQC